MEQDVAPVDDVLEESAPQRCDPLGHLGEQEIEPIEKPFVDQARLGLERRPDGVVLTEALGCGEYAEVVDPEGLQEIQLPNQTIAIAAFRDRCELAIERCATERPLLRTSGESAEVACHVAGEEGAT